MTKARRGTASAAPGSATAKSGTGSSPQAVSGIMTGSDVLAALSAPLAPAADTSDIGPAVLMARDVLDATEEQPSPPADARDSVWRGGEGRVGSDHGHDADAGPGRSTSLSRSVLLPRSWSRTSFELGVVFAAVAVVEIWMRGEVGFLGVSPCPYWAIVLPVAAARGVIAGLTAAAYATLLRCLAMWQAGSVTGVVQFLDLDRMFEPVLFAIFGYVIGELRDHVAERNARLARGLREMRDREERQARENRLLQSANRELRRRLFDNSADFETLITAVTGAESMAEASVFELPLSMVEERCGATKCSVLLVLPDGTVDLARHRGWEAEEIRMRVESANDSLFVRRAISESLPIHCFHPNAVVPKVGPLLVAPISDGTGVVKALLCLDEIPPRRFRDSTVQTFVSIADWVASSLRRVGGESLPTGLRAAVRQILRGDRSVDGPEKLGLRLRLEDARADRQGLMASLITLNAVDLEARIPGALDRLDRFLVDHLCPHLRMTDDFYRFGFPGYYVLVLTGTDRDGGLIVRDRLAAKLAALDTSKIGRIDVEVFVPGAEEASLVDLLPKLSENYYLGRDCREEAKCPVPIVADTNSHGDTVDFANRLRLELGVALRYGQELSVLDFRSSEVDIGGGLMVARYLSNLPASVLRGTDGIYVLGRDRCVVLLSGTDCLSASKVWQRLLAQLQASMPERRFSALETDFLSLDGSESQLLIDYFLGEEEPTDRALLTEQELKLLEFTADDLERFAKGVFAELSPEYAEPSSVDDTSSSSVPCDSESPVRQPRSLKQPLPTETLPMSEKRDPFTFSPPINAAVSVGETVFETDAAASIPPRAEQIPESPTQRMTELRESVEQEPSARVVSPTVSSATEEVVLPPAEEVAELPIDGPTGQQPDGRKMPPSPAPGHGLEMLAAKTSVAGQPASMSAHNPQQDQLIMELKLKILDLARLCMGLPDPKS